MNGKLAKTLIGAATLVLLLAGCASLSGSAGGVEVLSSGNYSNIKDQQYKDIHNQADFDALWKQAFGGLSGAPSEPTVDFTKNMILAGFIGEQKHGGYVLRFTQYDDSGPTVNVTVEVTIPGTNCRYPQREAQPFLIAAAPATTKQVNFNVTQRNAPACG